MYNVLVYGNSSWNNQPPPSWNELVATNAPVEDEAIEIVLRMNQKHILPAQSC
jgi:hypothetical protein